MRTLVEDYDIVVVGAGHAGCEAALAGARPQVLLHIRHDRHRLQQYHNLLLTFSFCLLLFYNCSFYSFKNRRRRFFDFYLPMQNLLNISFTRSSPTDSPRILPRFSYAFIRSIEKKSSGIPISILFLTRSRLLSASSNAAL